MKQTYNNGRVAEIKISYKNRVNSADRMIINGSKDAENILRPLFNDLIEHREAMYVILLNRANKVLGYFLVGIGGVSGVATDVKLIFQSGIKSNASSMILAHNHPSGNNKPSQADIELTKKVKEGCKLLEMSLLDHLIMLPGTGYYSFADEGHL